MTWREAGRPTLLHYCQHSVGLGHLVRSLSVAGALAREFRVVLVSGGKVPEGIGVPEGVELVPLPAIGSGNGEAGGLVSLEPGMDLESTWRRRREILLGLFEQLRPVAVVIEMFPLGRRKFATELLPLLEAARRRAAPPATICSVRDLLVANGPDQQRRDDQAARCLNALFDAVVVHADPRLARLQDTFDPSIAVTKPILYSGFVVPSDERPGGVRRQPPEIIVSAGGGMVGGPLLRAAAAAQRRYLGRLGLTTRIVTGPYLPAGDLLALQAEATGSHGLTLERFVPDLCAAMVEASVSVSQCGYNTALDVLRAGVPALVVPYSQGRETEQTERARRLGDLGALRVLPSGDVTVARLADEVIRLLSTVPPAVRLDLGGADATAVIVSKLVAEAGIGAQMEAVS